MAPSLQPRGLDARDPRACATRRAAAGLSPARHAVGPASRPAPTAALTQRKPSQPLPLSRTTCARRPALAAPLCGEGRVLVPRALAMRNARRARCSVCPRPGAATSVFAGTLAGASALTHLLAPVPLGAGSRPGVFLRPCRHFEWLQAPSTFACVEGYTSSWVDRGQGHSGWPRQ